MAQLSTRGSFHGASVGDALGLTFASAAAASDREATALGTNRSPRLEALGRAWVNNLEQQKIASRDSDQAENESAAQKASERFDELVDEECELSRAIRGEPARAREDLALKARVLLREINSFSNASFSPEGVTTPMHEWESMGVSLAEGIAASLALDLIRLAAEEG